MHSHASAGTGAALLPGAVLGTGPLNEFIDAAARGVSQLVNAVLSPVEIENRYNSNSTSGTNNLNNLLPDFNYQQHYGYGNPYAGIKGSNDNNPAPYETKSSSSRDPPPPPGQHEKSSSSRDPPRMAQSPAPPADEPPLPWPEPSREELDTLSWKERCAISESRARQLQARNEFLEAKAVRTDDVLENQRRMFRRMSALDNFEYQQQIDALKRIKDDLFQQNQLERCIFYFTYLVEQQKQDLQEILSTDRLCCTCLDKPSQVVFYPCCHLVCCPDCSGKVTHCPVCRRVIHQKLPVFIA
eukprot:g14173.t1